MLYWSIIRITTSEGKAMATMFNPAHPGRILRQYLGNLRVGEAAARLRIARTTLSRVLNGKAGISADMALRVAEATGTEATLWMDLQTQFDLWQASRKKRSKVHPFPRAA
jgi:addiction module HigA family antidote